MEEVGKTEEECKMDEFQRISKAHPHVKMEEESMGEEEKRENSSVESGPEKKAAKCQCRRSQCRHGACRCARENNVCSKTCKCAGKCLNLLSKSGKACPPKVKREGHAVKRKSKILLTTTVDEFWKYSHMFNGDSKF